MEEITKNTSIREFMEWFVSEYDGHWLSADIVPVVNRLEGYTLAKKDSEEHYILYSSLVLLKDFKVFLDVIKRYSDWKYRGINQNDNQ